MSSTELSSYVKNTDLNGKVSESISGLLTENSTNSAVANLFSRIKTTETNTNNAINALSGVSSRVKNLEDNGVPATESSVMSSINVNKDAIATLLSEAGLVNTATLNDATTTLGTRITNAENTASGAASAVSDLTTRVKSLEKGGYISENSLVAAIKNKKDQIVSQAGLVDKASLNSAESTLGARITNAENTANGASSAVSGLTTRVQNIENGGYISESSLVSAIKDKKDKIISEAGLVSTAKLNEATSGIVASLGDYTKKAEIIANINNNTSTVKINADKVNINGVKFTASNISDFDSKAQAAAKGAITAQYINGLNITAKNLASDSVVSNKLNATSGTIGGLNLSSNSISSSNGNFSVTSAGALTAKSGTIGGI